MRVTNNIHLKCPLPLTVLTFYDGTTLKDPTSWGGNIDRSPCGSGTSAIMAAMHAKGELACGAHFRC
jgi:hypothetical protein